MRVALIGMTWFDEDPGGLNRYVLDLFGAMRAEGIEIEGVVVGSPPPGSGFVSGARPDGSTLRRVVGMWATGRATAKAADVINSHFALYALAVALTGPRRPSVVHFHGPWYLEAKAERRTARMGVVARRQIEAYVYRHADEMVVLSDEFRKLVIDDFRLLPSRVHRVPPGVDLQRFHPRDRLEARRALGLPLDATIFVCCRRLARRMGLEVLLRAWADVNVDAATLYIVGDGPLRDDLKRLSSELGIDGRTRLVGRVPEHDLPIWYSAADLSIVPSTELEGFGLIALESLACGTPVLASRIGGMATVVGDVSESLLVPPGDSGALSSALAAVAERRASLPVAGTCRAVAERFSWASVAQRIAGIYERARRQPPNRPFRVVFLDHCARLSGGELALLRLLGGFGNVDPYVILGEHGPLEERLALMGVDCEVLPLSATVAELHREEVVAGIRLARSAASTAGHTLRLAKRLRDLRPDLVHTNSLKAGIYGTIAARLARVPVIWHLRDRIDEEAYSRRVASAVRRGVSSIPDAVIVDSLTTAGSVSGTRVPVHVVPSPISVNLAEPAPEEPPSVGIVGRLAPWKGQHVFLEAFAELVADVPQVHARVIGSAMFGEQQYEERLRSMCRDLGIEERVDFLGFREDIGAEFSRLSVAVHASTRAEPFGQVVLEAMAAGVPVVASAAGGPSETVVDGVNGILVPPGNSRALAQAVRRLLEDGPLRERLISSGRETAARYRPERVAPVVEAVYAEVLRGRLARCQIEVNHQ